ncbi:hypothetical protein, partial [Azospirillum brasilense]|uniref:hypothetical protein n=1 Tax=Azospirillum brasilense TaxID=192 RepID=UPI0019654805
MSGTSPKTGTAIPSADICIERAERNILKCYKSAYLLLRKARFLPMAKLNYVFTSESVSEGHP